MVKNWQSKEIDRLLFQITSSNSLSIAKQIGRLVAGKIDFADDDAMQQIERERSRLMTRARELAIEFGTDHHGAFLLGIDNPMTQRATENDYILVPGEHIDDSDNRTEHPICDVVDAILSRFPDDVLYQWALIVGTIEGKAGDRRFRPSTADHMRYMIDRHCKLARWKSGKSGSRLEYVSCSRDIATAALSAAETHANVREITMLVSYPIYAAKHKSNAKGGICAPGYNYGIYYDEPDELRGLFSDLPDISRPENNPKKLLYDLVCDFPFADESSRDNFIGLLLTPILRPALKGNTPLHMVAASLERTGKSKLLEDVLGGVILGKATQPLNMSGDDDEIDKRILSMLLMGDTILYIDNVNEFMDSASIARLLTCAVYAGRVLGKSQIIKPKNNLTLAVTGNNPKATGEIVKRTVPIVLQPLSDAPQDRTDFRHPDIGEYAIINRRRILGVLIAMVESWRANGAKRSAVPFGGFGRWAGIVGGILEMHGFTSWMKNQKAWSSRTDPRGNDLRSFVGEWGRVYGENVMAAKELWGMCKSNEWFIELLGASESGELVKFSRQILSKNEDRPVGEYTIRRREVGGKTQWRLDRTAKSATVEIRSDRKDAEQDTGAKSTTSAEADDDVLIFGDDFETF